MSNVVSFSLPNRLKAMRKRVLNHEKEGRFREVIDLLGSAPIALLEDDLILCLARSYRECNQPAKALSIVSECQTNPLTNPSILRLLIDVHLDLENYERVLFYTDALFNQDRNVAREIEILISVYNRLGLLDRGVELSRFLFSENLISSRFLPLLVELALQSADTQLINSLKGLKTGQTRLEKPMQQALKRLDVQLSTRSTRQIFFQLQGTVLLGEWYDSALALAVPTGLRLSHRGLEVPKQIVIESLRRLKLLLNLSGIRFDSILQVLPSDRALAELCARELQLPLSRERSENCLVVSEILCESMRSGYSFCLAVAKEGLVPQGPDFAVLVCEADTPAVLGNSCDHLETVSSLSLNHLKDLYQLIHHSRLPKTLHRITSPNLPYDDLLEFEPLASYFAPLYLEDKCPDPKDVLLPWYKALFQGLPCALTLAQYLHKHKVDIKFHLLNMQNELPQEHKVITAYLRCASLVMSLDELSDVIRSMQIPSKYPESLWLSNTARVAILLDPDLAAPLCSLLLSKKPFPLLRQVLEFCEFPNSAWHAFRTQFHKLTALRQNEVIRCLLDTPHSLSQVQLHDLLNSLRETSTLALELVVSFDMPLAYGITTETIQAQSPELRAHCISHWRKKDLLQKEWELYLQDASASALLLVRGVPHKALLNKIIRYCNSLPPSHRVPLYRFLLHNGGEPNIHEILSDPCFKSLLRCDLIAGMEQWIVRTDGDTDLLFLLGCRSMSARVHLAKNLLCLGNLEGWFLLERSFQRFYPVIGPEIIHALLQIRPDKAMELLCPQESNHLNPEQILHVMKSICNNIEYLDEWHSHCGQIRNQEGVTRLKDLILCHLHSYPKMLTYLPLFFPRENLAAIVRNHLAGLEFSEDIYRVLRGLEPSVAAMYLGTAGFASFAATLIRREEIRIE